MTPSQRYSAFTGNHLLVTGTLEDVAKAVRSAAAPALVFDNTTGRVVDLDPREPYNEPAVPAEPEDGPRGRGRPKLGVVAREVTLLPRHWDWLSSQPGGASVVLRRLVDEARKASGDHERVRLAQEAANRFMTAMGGDLPGFEEATRALFAYDRRRFADLLAAWPEDIRDHAIKLAFSDLEPPKR